MSVISNSGKLFTLGLLTAALAACGGGGGSSSTPASNSSSTTTSGSGSTSTGSSSTGSSSTGSGSSSSSSGSTTGSGSSNSGSSNTGSGSKGSTGSGTGSSGSITAHFLYAPSVSSTTANGTNIYTIGANGVLKLTSSVTGNPDWLNIEPTGRFVYVSSNNGASGTGNETIYQYSLNTDGSLTPLSTPTQTTNLLSGWTSAIVFDPTGKFAYVSGQASFGSSSFSLDTFAIAANGTLSLLSTQSYPSGVTAVEVNPVTNTLYVLATNSTGSSSTITVYSIGSSGTLTAVGSPVAVATNAADITFDPSGKFAYVPSNTGTTSNGSVYEYTVGSNGALTPMSTPSVTVGMYPTQIVIDPSDKYAYVTNMFSNSISQFSIGANGNLTPLATPTVTVTAGKPNFIVANPTGGNVYVTSIPTSTTSTIDSLTTYNIGSDGSLSAGGTTSIGTGFLTVH